MILWKEFKFMLTNIFSTKVPKHDTNLQNKTFDGSSKQVFITKLINRYVLKKKTFTCNQLQKLKTLMTYNWTRILQVKEIKSEWFSDFNNADDMIFKYNKKLNQERNITKNSKRENNTQWNTTYYSTHILFICLRMNRKTMKPVLLLRSYGTITLFNNENKIQLTSHSPFKQKNYLPSTPCPHLSTLQKIIILWFIIN